MDVYILSMIILVLTEIPIDERNTNQVNIEITLFASVSLKMIIIMTLLGNMKL